KLESAYWALARADAGWRLECAFDETIENWEGWCRANYDLPAGVEPLGYVDGDTGDARIAFFEGDRLQIALFIARQPVAVSRNWAAAQLGERRGDARTRFSVIAGRPGAGRLDPGATVCSCFSVGVNQIVAA